eukprot:tig00001208_g7542.t1
MKAVVVGSTGATGRSMVAELVNSGVWTSVVSLGRRTLPAEKFFGASVPEQASKLQQVVVDFDKPETFRSHLAGAETVFCCLGTTRAAAGSAEAFIKVDKDYVMNVAKQAKEAGVRHFSIQTSTGSNAKSSFLYPRTKGEVEEALKAMQFPRLTIFRPALLLTEREEKRTGEAIAQKLFSSLPSCILPAVLVPIKVETVARAMRIDAEYRPTSPASIATLESKEIQKVADANSRTAV